MSYSPFLIVLNNFLGLIVKDFIHTIHICILATSFLFHMLQVFVVLVCVVAFLIDVKEILYRCRNLLIQQAIMLNFIVLAWRVMAAFPLSTLLEVLTNTMEMRH